MSQHRHRFAINSQSKNREICDIRTFDSSNCESTFDTMAVSAKISERKIDARRFDSIHDILRSISLTQSLLKGRNTPIWRQQETNTYDTARNRRVEGKKFLKKSSGNRGIRNNGNLIGWIRFASFWHA